MFERIREQLEAHDELRRFDRKTPVVYGGLTDHGDDVLTYLRKRSLREMKRRSEEFDRVWGAT